MPQIYPEAESVSVFGGEDLNPPRYGRVYISIKPINGQYLSSAIKDNLKEELKKYSIAGIVPEIKDVKYIYVEVTSTVFYDPTLSNVPSGLKTTILDNVKNCRLRVNKYGSKFKYSKFTSLIDNSDDAILQILQIFL